MSRGRGSLTLLSLLIFTASAIPDGPADEAKRLAGTWRGVGGTWDGKALTAEQARRCVLTLYAPRAADDLGGGARGLDLLVPDGLVGTAFRTAEGKLETRYVSEWKGYGYSLDPAAKPPTLKAFKLVGIKGQGLGGVYRAEGETLTVCISLNNLVAYPKELKSPRGSEVLLLTLKRDGK